MDSGAIDGVEGGRERAASGDPQFRRYVRRERHDLDARLQVDSLAPPSQEAGFRSVGDSIDLAMRAAGGFLGYQAVPAVVACLVDVEEGYGLSDTNLTPFDVAD